MSHPKNATWIVLLTALVLSAIGCTDKKQQQIQALQGEKLALEQQRDALMADLQTAQAERMDLMNQIDARNADVAALQAQLRAAQALKSAPTPAAPEGWEKGVAADKVTLDTDILYASGKAELTSEGKKRLDKIAADLTSTYADLPVRVYGNTDNEPVRRTKGLWQDNLDLSANRAMNVTRYLISKGIPAARIETVAMGEAKPAASNTTAQGKAKNRRVEIYVIKEGS